MSNNLSANVRPQYGPESLAAQGTPVACNQQFVIATEIKPHPQLQAKKKAVGGSFRNRAVIPEEEWMNFDLPFDPDYREIGWLFSSCFGQPVSTITGNGTNGYAAGSYHHVWRPSSYQANNLQTFTLQYGVAGLVFQCSRALFNKCQIKTKRGSGSGNISGDASGFARRREATSPPNTFTAGINAIQTFDFTAAYGKTIAFQDSNGRGNAVGHNVTLSAATVAGDIQTAMDDIFGATNTLVGGSAGVFTITYQNALAGVAVGQINWFLSGGPLATTVVVGAGSATQNLTSTSGMHVGDVLTFPAGTRTIVTVTDATHVVLNSTITTVTADAVTKTSTYTVVETQTQMGGIAMYGFVPVLPNEISIWYSSLKSDLFVDGGSALMLNEFSTDLSWDKLSDPVFRQNRAENSYGTHAELGVAKGRSEMIDVTLAVDSQGMQFWDDWRAAAQKFWGWQALSQVIIAASTHFELRIFGSVSVASVKDYSDNDGIWSIAHQLEWTDNILDGGKAFEIHLTTDIASFAVA